MKNSVAMALSFFCSIIAPQSLSAFTVDTPFKTCFAPGKAGPDGQGLPGMDIAGELYEEDDFEPNNWDDPEGAFPPQGWNGDLGTIEYGDPSIVMLGGIKGTGFWPPLGGWYTGDTDLYGFAIPSRGILKLDGYFGTCHPLSAIYNIWWLAEGSLGNIWVLDTNFDYPHLNVNLQCNYEERAFIEPGFVLDPCTGETAERFYLLVAAANGETNPYTVTIGFVDCPDDEDEDGHPDEACGGWDCNDNDADVNPDAEEIHDDGIDNDCDDLVDEACFIGTSVP